MRQYELTVLIHPDLEMNPQPALDKLDKIIETVGGKITKEVNEGKKHLAYPVAKQQFAVYYYYELDLPTEKGVAKKITDMLDIADEFIRYLLVTVDEKRLKLEARRKAAAHREAMEGTSEDADKISDEEATKEADKADAKEDVAKSDKEEAAEDEGAKDASDADK